MSIELIIAVALAAAVVIIVLALVLIIVYQRWRISDNNVHLEKFINENIQLREKIRQYYPIDN
jgi:hypothetical protein